MVLIWSYIKLSKVDFETKVNLTIVLRRQSIGEIMQRAITKFGKIKQNKVHFAVQGHSRSPILIPIESSYTTSYQNDN